MIVIMMVVMTVIWWRWLWRRYDTEFDDIDKDNDIGCDSDNNDDDDCSVNPLTAEWALRAGFTLSNARRFYSSMGNPLDGKGLRTMVMMAMTKLSWSWQ